LPDQDADDYSSGFVERDERRLAELGRRAVEMFALAHIFAEAESAFCEAESIKRQDELIREVRLGTSELLTAYTLHSRLFPAREVRRARGDGHLCLLLAA
jgi:hypothetical protein